MHTVSSRETVGYVGARCGTAGIGRADACRVYNAPGSRSTETENQGFETAISEQSATRIEVYLRKKGSDDGNDQPGVCNEGKGLPRTIMKMVPLF